MTELEYRPSKSDPKTALYELGQDKRKPQQNRATRPGQARTGFVPGQERDKLWDKNLGNPSKTACLSRDNSRDKTRSVPLSRLFPL